MCIRRWPFRFIYWSNNFFEGWNRQYTVDDVTLAYDLLQLYTLSPKNSYADLCLYIFAKYWPILDISSLLYIQQ